MTGDFASRSYFRALLYLDESTDFGFIANFATVEVDESCQANVAAKLYVRGNLLAAVTVAGH